MDPCGSQALSEAEDFILCYLTLRRAQVLVTGEPRSLVIYRQRKVIVENTFQNLIVSGKLGKSEIILLLEKIITTKHGLLFLEGFFGPHY